MQLPSKKKRMCPKYCAKCFKYIRIAFILSWKSSMMQCYCDICFIEEETEVQSVKLLVQKSVG